MASEDRSCFSPDTPTTNIKHSPGFGSPSRYDDPELRARYKKLPPNRETFLAYVVGIRDPLNLHLDIYWPPEFEQRYESAVHYPYEFISEELGPEVGTET